MPALGIDMSDREETKGWADTTPTLHPQNILYALSLSAWKLSIKMVDDGREWDEIKGMQDLAAELEILAKGDVECSCVLPEQSCRVCRATSRLSCWKELYEK